MGVVESTADYEAWLRTRCAVVEADLAEKHRQMAADRFAFFRGTYYRWAKQWPKLMPAAPTVFGLGDVHVENFGTWRDAEGRLVWGANDFDEADDVPYTNDLVRLAASIRLAMPADTEVKFGRACGWVLQGYETQLRRGAEAFVLEENHPDLRAMAMGQEREPAKFWRKFVADLREVVEPPADAAAALLRALGHPPASAVFHRRVAGVGSLGKPRFVLLAEWGGSYLAREAKATTPPATAWLAGRGGSRAAELLAKLARCPDPFYDVGAAWTVRRVGPRCSKIDLAHLTALGEYQSVFTAMGAEVANVHLGSPAAKAPILAHLKQTDWLKDAAKAMAEAVQADWEAWRTHAVTAPRTAGGSGGTATRGGGS